MAGFYGADIEQLRQLARQFATGSRQLHDSSALLTGSLGASAWAGLDSERFRQDWSGRHRGDLLRVSAALEAASQALLRQAVEQEQASVEGGGGHYGSSGGPGGDGDRPGDPKLQPDQGDYVPIEDPISFDDQALDADQINQGQVGDCWLLAALGSVVDQDPQWIRDHMWQNPDGTWTVKMYHDGEPVYIQVEPTLPEHGAKDAAGNQSWLSIYEKAAAEYFGGSYDDIDGGYSDRALEAITGNPANDIGEASFDQIEQALEKGPVTVSSEVKDKILWFFGDTVDDPDKVVPQHAYIVRDIETVTNPDGSTERYLVVTNPWGTNADDGRYGTLRFTEQEYRDNFRSVQTGTIGD